MYIRKIDRRRYYRFRNKGLPLYKSERVSCSDVRDLPEVGAFIASDLLERFKHELRRRHAFDKKQYTVEAYQDYDIDYNSVRFVVKQRFITIFRKKAS